MCVSTKFQQDCFALLATIEGGRCVKIMFVLNITRLCSVLDVQCYIPPEVLAEWYWNGTTCVLCQDCLVLPTIEGGRCVKIVTPEGAEAFFIRGGFTQQQAFNWMKWNCWILLRSDSKFWLLTQREFFIVEITYLYFLVFPSCTLWTTLITLYIISTKIQDRPDLIKYLAGPCVKYLVPLW